MTQIMLINEEKFGSFFEKTLFSKIDVGSKNTNQMISIRKQPIDTSALRKSISRKSINQSKST